MGSLWHELTSVDLVIGQVKGSETGHHAMLRRSAGVSPVGRSEGQAHDGMPSPSSESFTLPSATPDSRGCLSDKKPHVPLGHS